MANAYYQRTYDYTPYSPSRGETLRDEFEAIEHGFDLITAAVGQIAGTSGVNIGFTAGDLSPDVITTNAAGRADTLLGFDENGLTVLRGPNEIEGYGGAWRVTAPGHAKVLPVHGFIPVYRTSAAVVNAQADVLTSCATAFVVAIHDNNTLRVMGPGLRRVTGHGLAIGTMYFLAQGAPGITATMPATGLVQPVCEVWDADTVQLMAPIPVST